MAQIDINQHADYSANNVGKYDFERNIFRKKIENGKYERNYVKLNGTPLQSLPIVSLGSKTRLKASFLWANHNTEQHIFSVADYIAKRSATISLTVRSNKLYVTPRIIINNQITIFDVYFNEIANINDSEELTVDCVFDFSNNNIPSILVNGEIKTYVANSPSTVTTDIWNTTSTVCFGGVANYKDKPQIYAWAHITFGQLLSIDGNILLHYDFLGDDNVELLQDKVSYSILKGNLSVSEIVNSPID